MNPLKLRRLSGISCNQTRYRISVVKMRIYCNQLSHESIIPQMTGKGNAEIAHITGRSMTPARK